jgi:hypothetical protein
MRVETGKWYLMRNGRKAFIEHKTSDIYCMKGFIEGDKDRKYAWALNGAYFDDEPDSYDLVRELEIPVEGDSDEN